MKLINSKYVHIQKPRKNNANRNKLQSKKALSIVMLLMVILTVVIPFVQVGFKIAADVFNEPSMILHILSVRRLNIIIKTLGFSFSVAGIVVVFGFFAGLSLFSVLRGRKFVLLVIAGFMMVPPYIHAFFWMKFMWLVMGQAAVSGVGISVLVQSLYFLPLCSGVWYVFFGTVAPEYFYEASLNKNNEKGRTIVYYELGRGIAVLLLVLVGMLSMADYTIPSIFAFNTYPVEIMSIFSSYYDLTLPMLATIPIQFIGLFIVAILFRLIRPEDFQLELQHFELRWIDDHGFKLPSLYKFFLSCLLVITYIVIPIGLILMDMNSIMNSIHSLTNVINDSVFSIFSSICAATLILLVAFYFNYHRFRTGKKNNGILIFMLFILAMTGTIIGLFVNGFYQNLTDEFISAQFLAFTMIPTVHVFFLRFLPIGYFVLLFGFSQLDRSLLEALLLETNNTRESIRHCILPLTGKYIVLAWFSCFMFSFGELSGAMMVVPPGKSTLSVTIYNYLHYGSTEFVSLLCIIIVIMTFLLGGIFMLTNQRIKK